MPQCTLEVRLYNYVHVMNHDIILTEIEYVDIFSQPLKKGLNVSPLSKFVYWPCKFEQMDQSQGAIPIT